MVAKKPITICQERFYPHSPEDVWAAITDPYALAEWLEPNDHQPVAGHKFQFRCDPGLCGSGITECEVLEAIPPFRLVWSWVNVPSDGKRPRPKPMTISWTLTPKDNGTLLTLEHSGAENCKWLTRNMMRVGWGVMMKKMISRVLASVDAGKFRPGAIPLKNRYYTCKTIPDHFVR
ncbi:MAG: SRPBCC domain-containing protein [Planctomycetes bacterium]|nr:SRPBCC domain-containing protein [Planctomycetota bacterium]MBL7038948.1 SRPBCC domain-containing protein [Pirellulaceae bacterium]